MLRLSDAIPRDAIRAKIGDFEEKVTANTAAEYIERDPTGMMTTGLYGWDYAVAQQLVDDDQEIGAVYPARPDLFPGFLDKKWGDRKSVVSGKCVSVRVDPGGGRYIQKKQLIS